MYKLRLNILVVLFALMALVALLRLAFLQVDQCAQARQEIHDMQILPPQALPTLRGKIFDRYGRPLAKDAPAFYLHVSYQLTRLLDERFREGRIRRMINDEVTAEMAGERFDKAYEAGRERLDHVLEFARSLETDRRGELLEQARALNNRIWERSRYIFWWRSHPNASMAEYRAESDDVMPEDIVSIDLAEMHDQYPLMELEGEALVRAQIEFAGVTGVEIRPEGKRVYPYKTAACQLLGWAGPVQDFEKERFSHDEYLRYLDGELIGKAGLERVCEPLLRGRRGEVQYDKDGNELFRREPQYGRDVRLTLDIELQQRIETFLSDPEQNPAASQGAAAVVMDAATGDILAAVSTPLFDINTVRQEYGDLFKDPNHPLIHKALQRNYPPGSTVKPLVLAAGLQEGKVGPHEPISCPAHAPPRSWPSCLAQARFDNCHDWRWDGEGGNTGRNAIRGSCNIYFSRLADRLDERKLQEWLYQFGYGRQILPGPTIPEDLAAEVDRFGWQTLPQSPGSIIFGLQTRGYETFAEVPELTQRSEKRYWGIGQGNLRVTVLHVANALCVIARNGIYKSPRLIIDEDDPHNDRNDASLGLSNQTVKVVRDGLFAAVNESGGTGYNVFHDRQDNLLAKELKIHGKTGSTERPEIAWFECFAEDAAGRCIVIAVAVPGGQSGASDAAPLGKAILQRCYDMGHIGIRKKAAEKTTSGQGS